MIPQLEDLREESLHILSPVEQDQAAPRVLSALFGVSIHILLSSMAHAVVQAYSRWVVVGVKLVWLHIPHVAHWVDEAVWQIHGDGHGAPIIADKEAKGVPLAGTTPALRASCTAWRLPSMSLTKSRIWSGVYRWELTLQTMSPT